MPDALRVIREHTLPGRGDIYYYQDLNHVRGRILRDVKLAPDNKFLDIGAGDGWFAVQASRFLTNGLVAAIDLSLQEAVAAAAQARAVENPNTWFLTMDALQLAFRETAFDVIGSFMSLQDICSGIMDLQRLLGEIARVLRPEGLVLIATVTPEDAETESQKIGIELYSFIRACFFSKAEIIQALDAAKFQIEDVRFYYTGVNLSPASALDFIKFECSWWQETFHLPTVNWETAWETFGERFKMLGGLEVDAKITVLLARKTM